MSPSKYDGKTWLLQREAWKRRALRAEAALRVWNAKEATALEAPLPGLRVLVCVDGVVVAPGPKEIGTLPGMEAGYYYLEGEGP